MACTANLGPRSHRILGNITFKFDSMSPEPLAVHAESLLMTAATVLTTLHCYKKTYKHNHKVIQVKNRHLASYSWTRQKNYRHFAPLIP